MYEDALHRQLIARIRALALKRGWTPTHLAREAGISPSHIGRLMNNQQSPTVAMLKKIADALELDTRELFPRHDDPDR